MFYIVQTPCGFYVNEHLTSLTPAGAAILTESQAAEVLANTRDSRRMSLLIYVPVEQTSKDKLTWAARGHGYILAPTEVDRACAAAGISVYTGAYRQYDAMMDWVFRNRDYMATAVIAVQMELAKEDIEVGDDTIREALLQQGTGDEAYYFSQVENACAWIKNQQN